MDYSFMVYSHKELETKDGQAVNRNIYSVHRPVVTIYKSKGSEISKLKIYCNNISLDIFSIPIVKT